MWRELSSVLSVSGMSVPRLLGESVGCFASFLITSSCSSERGFWSSVVSVALPLIHSCTHAQLLKSRSADTFAAILLCHFTCPCYSVFFWHDEHQQPVPYGFTIMILEEFALFNCAACAPQWSSCWGLLRDFLQGCRWNGLNSQNYSAVGRLVGFVGSPPAPLRAEALVLSYSAVLSMLWRANVQLCLCTGEGSE